MWQYLFVSENIYQYFYYKSLTKVSAQISFLVEVNSWTHPNLFEARDEFLPAGIAKAGLGISFPFYESSQNAESFVMVLMVP